MGERNLIMAGVVREGDVNILGGVCQGGVSSVLVNGRPIAIPGMTVTPHPPCPFAPSHCLSQTSKGGGSLLGAAISFGASFFGGAIGEFIGPIGSTVSEFGPVQPIFTASEVGSAVSSAAGSAAGSLLGGGGGGVVLAAGKPVIVRGDHDKCICPRSSCSGDVQIG